MADGGRQDRAGERRKNTRGRRAGDRARKTGVAGAVRREERQGVKSFLEAWGVFFLLVLFLVLGVSIPSFLLKFRASPAASTSTSDAAPTSPKLPWDVPLISGASLTRYTASGQTSIYSYTVAQGSLAGVQSWYQTELEKRGWIRQPRSNERESEYQTNLRTLVITLNYQASHVRMQIEVVKKSSGN
jgi:hypothetical protein